MFCVCLRRMGRVSSASVHFSCGVLISRPLGLASKFFWLTKKRITASGEHNVFFHRYLCAGSGWLLRIPFLIFTKGPQLQGSTALLPLCGVFSHGVLSPFCIGLRPTTRSALIVGLFIFFHPTFVRQIALALQHHTLHRDPKRAKNGFPGGSARPLAISLSDIYSFRFFGHFLYLVVDTIYFASFLVCLYLVLV